MNNSIKEKISAGISPEITVWHFEEINSTNTFLCNSSKKGVHICIADYQRAGKGRQGASWQSIAGKNLLYSLKIPINNPRDTISCDIANRLLDTLISLIPSLKGKLLVKPPNDIVTIHEKKKLCGILVETSAHPALQKTTEFVIGIGCNIFWHPQTVPSTSIQDLCDHPLEAGVREEICIAVTNDLIAYFAKHLAVG